MSEFRIVKTPTGAQRMVLERYSRRMLRARAELDAVAEMMQPGLGFSADVMAWVEPVPAAEAEPEAENG